MRTGYSHTSLIGHQIDLWCTPCSSLNISGNRPEPFVNLYVRVTNGCNAACAFCCNGSADKRQNFNLEKFYKVLEELERSEIRLNRLTLTGGEPSLRFRTVEKIVEAVRRKSRFHFTQVQLHTNGLTEDAVALMALSQIDSVSLSLHHYDMDILGKIYGVTIPVHFLNFPSSIKSKVNLSCNLIKGYIDCAAEIEKLIKFAGSKGFNSLGFAGLMRLNSYAEGKYVNPWSLDFSSIPKLVKTDERNHEGACRCRNYIYAGSSLPVGVYVRETIDTDYCASTLLYDGEYLRQGHSGNNIIL